MKLHIRPDAIAFHLNTGLRMTPRYRFNAAITLPVESTRQRGLGVHEKTDYLVTVDGKQLAVSGHNANREFFTIEN